MQVLQAQTTLPLRDTSQISTSSKSLVQRAGHAFRSVRARLATILDRRAQAEAAIANRYAGHGWTDSTERQLNRVIAYSHLMYL
jgi:hypothetical protein